MLDAARRSDHSRGWGLASNLEADVHIGNFVARRSTRGQEGVVKGSSVSCPTLRGHPGKGGQMRLSSP